MSMQNVRPAGGGHVPQSAAKNCTNCLVLGQIRCIYMCVYVCMQRMHHQPPADIDDVAVAAASAATAVGAKLSSV